MHFKYLNGVLLSLVLFLFLGLSSSLDVQLQVQDNYVSLVSVKSKTINALVWLEEHVTYGDKMCAGDDGKWAATGHFFKPNRHCDWNTIP